jgi:hypothetical protein
MEGRRRERRHGLRACRLIVLALPDSVGWADALGANMVVGDLCELL